MNTTWKDYKEIATETSGDKMSFFKLETAIANVPITQFLVTSLYRSLLINKTKTLDATSNAVKLRTKISEFGNKIPKHFTNQQFNDLLTGSLNIPKGNSKNIDEYLISPLIPEIAYFGGNMRKTSAWNPGAFIMQIIANCSSDVNQFENTNKILFETLSAQNTIVGNLWIDLLKEEFDTIREKLNIDSKISTFNDIKDDLINEYYNSSKVKIVYNNSNFSNCVIADINNICEIGNSEKVTRQQWIGLLESYFRLLIFNHSINTLNQSRAYFSVLIEILKSNSSNQMSDEFFKKFINFEGFEKSNTNTFLNVMSKANEFINKNIEDYCLYNHFLYCIFDKYDIKIDSRIAKNQFIIETNKLLNNFSNSNELITEFNNYKEQYENLINNISIEDRQLAQISECLIYISQKKIIPKDLKSYIPDVNYIFSRRSGIHGNPYMFDLGSGTISMLIALIFKKKGNVSFITGIDFINSLRDYNIELSVLDISSGHVKYVLQSLGIVIDSPDNEGGVLIIRPGWI